MKLKQAPAAPPLRPVAAAMMLDGPAAEAPVTPGENTFDRNGFSGGVLEFFMPDGPARLWRLHEQHLRQLAARWGWEPQCEGPDGRRRFYAEHLAAGFKEHEASRRDDEHDDDDDPDVEEPSAPPAAAEAGK